MSLYATINNFIAENAIIFSVIIPLISGAIGAYVSYKITIKSEKRKEFNENAEPLIDRVELLVDLASHGAWGFDKFYNLNLRPIYRRLTRQNRDKLEEFIRLHEKLTDKLQQISDDEAIKLGKDIAFGYEVDISNIQETKIYLSNLREILKIIKLK